MDSVQLYIVGYTKPNPNQDTWYVQCQLLDATSGAVITSFTVTTDSTGIAAYESIVGKKSGAVTFTNFA